jgi:hypothetical protein
MCRSIKRLRGPDGPATAEEIREAALQYVRKVSGFREPSRRNAEAFEEAIEEVAASSRKLIDAVTSGGASAGADVARFHTPAGRSE